MIAKLAIVEEEADEALYWMELLADSKLVPKARLIDLNSEINQIVAMIVASQKRLRRNRPKSKIQNPK